MPTIAVSTSTVERIRTTAAWLVLALLAAQVPILLVAQLVVLDHVNWYHPLATLLVALMAMAAWRVLPAFLWRRVLAAALTTAGAISVWAFAGNPWQTGMQLYLFILVAVVTGFCDWRALLYAAVVVALFFGGAGLMAPAAVGVAPGEYLHIIMYIWLASFEAMLLAWLAQTMLSAFQASDSALADAQTAHTELAAATAARQEAEAAARQERGRMLLEVAQRLETDVGTLAHEVAVGAGRSLSSADELRHLVQRGSDNATHILSSGENALNGATQVAAAAQQLAGAITEISGQITRSSMQAREAAERARSTQAVVRGLSAAADSIGGVLATITEIAERTNLLALNATIEAARAGVAGKGFAVVASEVKNLAGQTAQATQEVAAKVAAIRDNTGDAADAIEAITAVIIEVDAATAAIAAAVEEQDAATNEIARSAASAVEGAGEAAKGCSATLDAWTEANGAADGIATVSQDLSSHMQRLNTMVHGVVSEIRSRVS